MTPEIEMLLANGLADLAMSTESHGVHRQESMSLLAGAAIAYATAYAHEELAAGEAAKTASRITEYAADIMNALNCGFVITIIIREKAPA